MFDQADLNRFYRYALSLCAIEADAYDLLQSALEKYLHAKNRDTIDYPEAYIRRIIRNLYIDQYRRQQRQPADEFDELQHSTISDISGHSLEQIMINKSTLESLWCKLNDKERELLYLWAVLGHTIDEIALELDCPRGTLLARIHRLRKKLQTPQAQGATA